MRVVTGNLYICMYAVTTCHLMPLAICSFLSITSALLPTASTRSRNLMLRWASFMCNNNTHKAHNVCYLLTHPVYVWMFAVVQPSWLPNTIKVILLLFFYYYYCYYYYYYYYYVSNQHCTEALTAAGWPALVWCGLTMSGLESRWI